MNLLFCSCLFFFFIFIHRISGTDSERAGIPPRGWNSYDSFCWIVSEEEFLNNAEFVASNLKSHGYEYVVVDYLWYRKNVPGSSTNAAGFDIVDEWGRPVPDPSRWPSAANGTGFKEVAHKVHSLRLKFGIHVMRGLSLVAYNANAPILDVTTGQPYQEGGRTWTTKDIGLQEKTCAWMKQGFMSVNTELGAGRAFLKSLYHQYDAWGVDFVKHDCVFGDDLDIKEISFVSETLKGLNRPILYSISPGTSVTPDLAKKVNGLVNMYRIAADDWDRWDDVAGHFDISRDMAAANMIGASGQLGRSWPDLDMLPLGWLTDPDSNQGPYRTCRLTLDEQRTQVTLWAMAKSPLMFGGDLRRIDNTTFNLITNPTLLDINSFSRNNKEISHIVTTVAIDHPRTTIKAGAPSDARLWTAIGSNGEIYLAFFNLTPQQRTMSATIAAIIKETVGGEPAKASCKVTDIWGEKDLGVITDNVSTSVPSHGTSLFALVC